MATFSDYVKNIILFLVLVQLAPVLIKNIRTQYSDLFEQKTRIGVLSVTGKIMSSTPLVKHIKELFTDSTIKGIVLKIDSEGGSAPATQALFNELLHYKKAHPEKYVVAFTESMAVSGSYYLASGADYIVASPSSFIGSIGVIMILPQLKKLAEQFNVNFDITKTGSYKAAGNPLTDMTPQAKEQFQRMSNNTYKQFVRDVAKQRPQLPSDTTKWAEGRLFTGEEALEIGLIDQLGSQSTVEQVLRDKAPVVGNIEWIKPAHKRPLLASLFAPEEDGEDKNYLSMMVNSICSALEARYNTPTLS